MLLRQRKADLRDAVWRRWRRGRVLDQDALLLIDMQRLGPSAKRASFCLQGRITESSGGSFLFTPAEIFLLRQAPATTTTSSSHDEEYRGQGEHQEDEDQKHDGQFDHGWSERDALGRRVVPGPK